MSPYLTPLVYFFVFVLVPGLWLVRAGFRRGFWSDHRLSLALGLGVAWHLYSLSAYHVWARSQALGPWPYFIAHLPFFWALRDWFTPKGLIEHSFALLNYRSLSKLGQFFFLALPLLIWLLHRGQLPAFWLQAPELLERLGLAFALDPAINTAHFFSVTGHEPGPAHVSQKLALYLSAFGGLSLAQAYFIGLPLISWIIVYLGFASLVDRATGRRFLIWLLFLLWFLSAGSLNPQWHDALLEPEFVLALALFLLQLFGLMEVRRGERSAVILLPLALGPLVVLTAPLLAPLAVLPGFFLSIYWWIAKQHSPRLFLFGWAWPGLLALAWFMAGGNQLWHQPPFDIEISAPSPLALNAGEGLSGVSGWIYQSTAPLHQAWPLAATPILGLLVALKAWLLLILAPIWAHRERPYLQPGVAALIASALSVFTGFLFLEFTGAQQLGFLLLFQYLILLGLAAAMQFQPAVPRGNQRPAYLLLALIFTIALGQHLFEDLQQFGPPSNGLSLSPAEREALELVRRHSKPASRLGFVPKPGAHGLSYPLLAQRPALEAIPPEGRPNMAAWLTQPQASLSPQEAQEKWNLGAMIQQEEWAFDPAQTGWELFYAQGDLKLWLPARPEAEQ